MTWKKDKASKKNKKHSLNRKDYIKDDEKMLTKYEVSFYTGCPVAMDYEEWLISDSKLDFDEWKAEKVGWKFSFDFEFYGS